MKPTGFLNGIFSLPFARTLPVGVLALSACAVGPNFHQPPPPSVPLTSTALPAATQSADGKVQTFVTAADISGEWWTLFHSPELNTLINAALANNPSLQAAQATLREAEENVRAGQAAFFPSLSASFQAQQEQTSSSSLSSYGAGGTGSNRILPPFTLYDASLKVSYAPDVFGGTRRQVEGLVAQAEYQRYELEAAYLTLTANIVTSAVAQASFGAQIDATNQVIAAEQRQLSILNSQVSLGGAAEANVLSEQAILAASQATLPPLESQLAQARNQLAAYVGAFPGNFHAADFTLGGLQLPEALPVSLPSAIIVQRPDIAAAAAQLHQASANVGVADANMLPQISLTADIGHSALTAATLFTPQTLLWSLVGGVTQPIFEAGKLSAQRKAALAALQVSSAQYQSTVISAFQNVADALTILQYDAITLKAAQSAATAAAQSLSVTENAYQLGAQPFTAVLTAQTSYQNALITQVKANAARLADTAALFQALGGGWWHRNDVSANCCGIIP